jgi:hypothetical protein
LDIERIVEQLEQERDRISQAIASLKGIKSSGCASSKLSPLDFIGGFERLG